MRLDCGHTSPHLFSVRQSHRILSDIRLPLPSATESTAAAQLCLWSWLLGRDCKVWVQVGLWEGKAASWKVWWVARWASYCLTQLSGTMSHLVLDILSRGFQHSRQSKGHFGPKNDYCAKNTCLFPKPQAKKEWRQQHLFTSKELRQFTENRFEEIENRTVMTIFETVFCKYKD